jgi:hypothetical protein
MIVKLFMPQFAPKVEDGTKRQTVRPTPKRRPKVGERLSLREWTGKPYWSKQRVLRETVLKDWEPVTIYPWNLQIGTGLGFRNLTRPNHNRELDAFAVADGFRNFGEMFEWFERQHSRPFSGIVLYWDL